MLLLVNCALSSPNRASRVLEEAGERRAHASLRPRPFEYDAVEDFDLIEMVALGLKELPPLLDCGLHDWIVIVCKGDLRAGSA